jgi:hypothetical protein
MMGLRPVSLWLTNGAIYIIYGLGLEEVFRKFPTVLGATAAGFLALTWRVGVRAWRQRLNGTDRQRGRAAKGSIREER